MWHGKTCPHSFFCGDEFKKMVEMACLTGLLFKEDLASIF